MTDAILQAGAPGARPLDQVARLGRAPAAKAVVIGFVALSLMVPLFFVQFLVIEREARSKAAADEIGEAWGRQQTIVGPVLIVPATEGDRGTRRRLVLLPERLSVEATAATESRRRGIFDTIVYRARAGLTGRFAPFDPASVSPSTTLHWEEAVLAIGLSDVRGIESPIVLETAAGEAIPFDRGIGIGGVQPPGVHARLRSLAPASGFEFRIALDLAGSSRFDIAPLGRDTEIRVAGDWPHPSFVGTFLPDERKVESSGFGALWRVPYLARTNPQSFFLEDLPFNRFNDAIVGVQFYKPVDLYRLVSRAVKYSILFIGPALLIVFVVELVAGQKFHFIQYILIGLALVLFYVLLLSFAERFGFEPAYLGASLATILLIGAYVGTSLQRLSLGVVTSAALALLYGVLYLVLRSEDDALMAGSVAAFLALATTMFATRRVDWSGRTPRPAS